jgi:nicotinate-nucleotide adenylyltransferase
MRVALFGGTFDPIHHGHLIMARDALELLGLERVIFIPAAISPHKLHTHPVPAPLRAEMVRAAIAGEPRFAMDELELHRPGPSYTIDTVEAIHAAHPGAEIIYLIGEDNVPALGTWHRIEELRRLVEFVVFGRGRHVTPGTYRLLPRRLDISSTEIRERIAQGLSIAYLVPEPVRALLEQHHLYQARPADL